MAIIKSYTDEIWKDVVIMEDPNKYVGSVFVWDEEKVKEIMQDIVNFTKQSSNNIRWR